MDNTNQQLKKQFEALPLELQKAILSVDLSSKLQEITQKNKLMIDQAGALETETTLVLFGLEPLGDYIQNLVKNAGLSNIQASTVAHDVDELIFKNIRESLKRIGDEITETEKIDNQNQNLKSEDILAGIEHPEKIKETEQSISISSLPSNNIPASTTISETIKNEIEIRPDNLPVENKDVPLPSISIPVKNKDREAFHQNISPVNNIVESKLTNEIIVPKETSVVEEKAKLPEKQQKVVHDPYREPLI